MKYVPTATLGRALRMTKVVHASAPPTALILRVNVTRSWQPAGSVYATLSGRERGDLALQDRQVARAWYQRALDQWRRLEPLTGLKPAFRRPAGDSRLNPNQGLALVRPMR